MLFLRRARRGEDNRALDISIGVANSAGRPLVVYVEALAGSHPPWLDELAESLRARSVGLFVGTEEARETALRALGPVALLYEHGEVIALDPEHAPMPLDVMPVDVLVAKDPLPTAFWEKVGRAADYALPRGAIVPTGWCVASELPVVARGHEKPTPATSPSAARNALSALATTLAEDKVQDVADAIAEGMLPFERAIQAIVESRAPRDRQEVVLRALSPALRAL